MSDMTFEMRMLLAVNRDFVDSLCGAFDNNANSKEQCEKLAEWLRSFLGIDQSTIEQTCFPCRDASFHDVFGNGTDEEADVLVCYSDTVANSIVAASMDTVADSLSDSNELMEAYTNPISIDQEEQLEIENNSIEMIDVMTCFSL